MTFRQIPLYPDYDINRSGIVKRWVTDRLSYEVVRQTLSEPHGVVHLGAEISGTVLPCWALILLTFSGPEEHRSTTLLLPRDGNFLNLREDNLFPFNVSTNCRIRYASDIHGVWHASIMEKVPCNKMAERLNLPQYGAHEFRVLIGEILLTGIR